MLIRRGEVRALVTLRGGGHCQAADDGNLPDAARRDYPNSNGIRAVAQLSGVGSGLKISLRCAATTIVCCAVRAQAGFESENRRAFSRL